MSQDGPLRPASSQQDAKLTFHSREPFSPGLLPSEIEMMIYHLMPKDRGFKQVSKEEASRMVVDNLLALDRV